MVGEIVGLDMSWKLGEGTGFVQEARKYSVLARQIDHYHTEVIPGEDLGCQVDQLALHKMGITGETVLVEGHDVADLHLGEGDGWYSLMLVSLFCLPTKLGEERINLL